MDTLADEIIKDPNFLRGKSKSEIFKLEHHMNAEINQHDRSIRALQRKVEVIDDITKWLENPQPKLEKNDCSRLHKLKQSSKDHCIWFLLDDFKVGSDPALDGEIQSFVVRHHWAEAFGCAIDELEPDFILPYPKCAFEFRIDGKNVIVIMQQVEGEAPIMAAPYVECGPWWLRFRTLDSMKGGRPDDIGAKVDKFLFDQIRAICIALDTEVAIGEAVRQPHKLNQKRLSKGQQPLLDYHVVNLARKSRMDRLLTDGEPRTRVRLHFRRGHWRHYDGFKTWIRWTLVGDPDLGFIDHHYQI